jgi:serine phosphatase RsbU (regulator of sigma subunit)
VGGDFYDFLQLADGHVGLVVGDVSGKGIPAAVLMANTLSVLRTVAQRGSAPGQALTEANEVLCAHVPPNLFITCFYAILEPESGHLIYANVGHNLPCYRRHNGQADELRARGLPLGLMPGMSYEEKEVVLEAGDSALFYTDGLVEAHNPQGEMFGTPRLRSLLSEGFESGRILSATLVEELERFIGEGWEQEDDITLLTLRRFTTRG